jgi:outer membrane protein TolC
MTTHMRVRLRFLRISLACLAVIAGAVTPAAAQQILPPQLPVGPLTLAHVLEIAEARSEAIGIARAGISRADANRIRARADWFPQLSASGSYDRAFASEFDGLFTGSTLPGCSPFQLNQQGTLDARVAELERAVDCGATGSSLFGGSTGSTADGQEGLSNLPFGRVNTWRIGLSFSQSIYSGGRTSAQEAVAIAGRESADLALRNTRGQLLLDASQAYFDAALSDRLVRIAQATVDQADATLKQVQAGFDAGTQPEFEVLRARVNRDNQTPVLIRQLVNREIALLRLKQLLDLPPAYDLQIAEPLDDVSLETPEPFGPRVAAVEDVMRKVGLEQIIQRGLGLPLPQRTAVDAAASELRRSQASLKLAEAQKMPSVSLNSTYGRVSYPSGPVWGFSDLRANWTVGASVQVPILTGGRQRGDELAARADVEESRLRLQQMQQMADLDTRVTWAELVAARATWEASAGTVQQAARAYEIADVRYRAGVSTQLELSDSRLQLQQAEANRAQAARDVQVARAHVALLPELPVGTSTPGSTGTRAVGQLQPVPSQSQPSGAGAFRTAGAPGAQTQAGR